MNERDLPLSGIKVVEFTHMVMGPTAGLVLLSGPYEQRTALDEVTQMMGGLAYMTGLPERPLRAGTSVIDITGGMFGVIAILSALEQRHRTGLGQLVTSSLFETTAFLVGQHIAQQGVLGVAPVPMSVRTSAWAIYEIFESADNEKIFVGVVSDSLWKMFCSEFELTAFANDSSLDSNNQRVEQKDRILPVIREMFAGLDKVEMIARLEKSGIPFAPVNCPADLVEDPHMNASGALLEITLSDGERAGQKVKVPAIPLEMDHQKFGLQRDLPNQGSDSLEVLKELGYSPEESKSMFDEGLVR